MNDILGAIHWRVSSFCSGRYISAKLPVPYSLFTENHYDQDEVSSNKDLISTVRLSCDLLVPYTPVHALRLNVWGKQGLFGLS